MHMKDLCDICLGWMRDFSKDKKKNIGLYVCFLLLFYTQTAFKTLLGWWYFGKNVPLVYLQERDLNLVQISANFDCLVSHNNQVEISLWCN